MDNGALVIAVTKDQDWMVFQLPDGREIKVLLRDMNHACKSKVKVVIDCPKDIRVTREKNV